MKDSELLRSIRSTADFNRISTTIQERKTYRKPEAFALGLAHIGRSGRVLSVRFPFVNLNNNHGSAAIFQEEAGLHNGKAGDLTETSRVVPFDAHGVESLSIAYRPFDGDGKEHPNINALKVVATMSQHSERFDGKVIPVFVFVYDLQSPPTSTEDAFLRLYLLSTLQKQPNTMNLSGIFDLLTTCSRTREAGPIEAAHFDALNREYMLKHGNPLSVDSVDKFPRLTDHYVPSGVRIVDASCVRLGAYLSPGTVVMPAGFVNFNAGTLGKAMVEGRISQGVIVGAGSDIGGGASIMGTLSGGGKEVIRIGERCLIGANGGTGISLGDDCRIEAGLYVTAGMPVDIRGKDLHPRMVKALTLSGKDGLTFRRNGESGRVEVVPTNNKVELNALLHE